MFTPELSEDDADGLFTALDGLLDVVATDANALLTTVDSGRAVSTTVQQRSHSPSKCHHPDKRYKATYYQRKEEIEALKEKAAALEDLLRRMSAVDAPSRSGSVQDLYEDDIQQTFLRSAGTQALLSSYHSTFSDASALVPTAIYLHLPIDSRIRANILSSMREQKLQTAMRFMAERTQFLDLQQRHRQVDSCELPSGDFIATGLDLVQFKRGHSVRQVFNQFLQVAVDKEACFPEDAGTLVTQQGSHNQDLPFIQLVATLLVREGFSFECNLVVYSVCVDGTASCPGYALVTIDFVDQDDLHPYNPDMFGRKELTASFLLTEILTPNGRIVSMACWSHVRYRPPRRELTEAEKEAVRRDNGRWRQSMPAAMRKSLARYPPVT